MLVALALPPRLSPELPPEIRVELGPDTLIGTDSGVAVRALGDGAERAGRICRSRFVPFLGKVRSFADRVWLAVVRKWLRVRGGPGGNGE